MRLEGVVSELDRRLCFLRPANGRSLISTEVVEVNELKLVQFVMGPTMATIVTTEKVDFDPSLPVEILVRNVEKKEDVTP